MDEERVKSLIAKIRQKRELADLDALFVRKILAHFLKSNPTLRELLEKNFHPKSAAYKQVVKKVREQLRRSYGLFRGEKKAKEREELMELLSGKNWTHQQLGRLLLSHASTKERWQIYPELYRRLFDITGEPGKILDLGCGLHPLSFSFMKLKKLHYHALDISEGEVKILKQFFSALEKNNPQFQGKAEVWDITETARLSLLPEHDLCFLLKMTDILDKGRGHRKTEEVIKAVRASFIVVSFPTVTMSGKKMNYPRRRWIELLCNRLGYAYDLIEFPTEIFYVVKK